MIEGSKYCSDVMKKHLNKEIVITNKDNEYFPNSTKCWICDDDYIDTNVKVRDYFHITRTYSALHLEIVISMLNSIIKFCSYLTL